MVSVPYRSVSTRTVRGKWRPFANSIGPRSAALCTTKFHILQHANKAIDEVRRAEFFRKGGRMRGVVKGKRWLLLTRWMNLDSQKRQQLNDLFALNRRVMKAYLLIWNDPSTTSNCFLLSCSRS